MTLLAAALTALALASSSGGLTPKGSDPSLSLLAPVTICPNPSISASPAVQIKAMVCYHRYARHRAGVRDLRTSIPLFRSATLKGRWITACGHFTHTPCGHLLATTFSDVGYTRGVWSIGENLGWSSGSLASVREMFSAWLRSPEHRLNIVRPWWHDLGLARIHLTHLFGYDDVTLWVAHFGSH
jgi:uncharacterized protein YkwD